MKWHAGGVDVCELVGEVGAGDHLRLRPDQGGESTDVIPVRVSDEHVGDGCLAVHAKCVERGRGAGRRGAGVDGHHADAGDDEGDVCKVVAARHEDILRDLHQLPWHKAISVCRADGAVSEDGCVFAARPAGAFCIGGTPEVVVGFGETAPRATAKTGREWATVGEHPLQVAHSYLGARETRRQIGEHDSTQVARQTSVRCGAIELGCGIFNPGHALKKRRLVGQTRLEEARQCEKQRLVRCFGPRTKNIIAFTQAISGQVVRGKQHHRARARVWPGDGALQ